VALYDDGCDYPFPNKFSTMSWLTPIARSIPHHWKASLQAKRRRLKDNRSGELAQFAGIRPIVLDDWTAQIKISQQLKPSAYSDNKWHNLAIAMQQIEPVVIAPGQTFSFWHSLGNPTQKRGYQEGRALMNGQLKATIGGGLCQLSGLIYLLALHTDFAMCERHAHSKDIYTDETRFAPLGSDATVVYGYKDLRIKNKTQSPMRFQFELYKTHITATIMSIGAIPKYEIEFLVDDRASEKQVETRRYRPDLPQPEICSMNIYGM
jgi:vancomycin resistance protein VanW